jgi:hypothetical protein
MKFIITMKNHDMVIGLFEFKFKHNPFYEGYVFNKHPYIPYPTNLATKATKLLDLLHTNLCSPMQTPSHG